MAAEKMRISLVRLCKFLTCRNNELDNFQDNESKLTACLDDSFHLKKERISCQIFSILLAVFFKSNSYQELEWAKFWVYQLQYTNTQIVQGLSGNDQQLVLCWQ